MNEMSTTGQQEIRLQPSYSRWLTEEVCNLIDLVRNDEAIYNPRHKYYFCRPYVENFWREIDIRLRKNSGASLAKWTNLRISFRREYANFQEEKVPPCWLYFDRMLFLHPYLRNKKSSEPPKGLDPHLQEALAQISSYKSQHQTTTTSATASESPGNEYMDQYLSYCEDDPQSPPEELDDIIDDENQANSQNPNDMKSESDTEVEEKDNIQIQEHDDYKDIIIEISDDTSTPCPNELKQLSPQNDCGVTRSLLKRPRTELSNIAVAASNNVSMVRPLTLVSHPPVQTTNSSNRGELGRPSSASPSGRRNELCECKTDPDAMFLMSLLPDIRKLNGRDRGKIKIAFQNIVQEFLYPD